jgi:hypothetical protein
MTRRVPSASLRGSTDPNLTSPARLYFATITPLGEALLSRSAKPARAVPSAGRERRFGWRE